MIYNEIIQGNDFSKNLISFESEKYILFDCEIYSEFLYLHKRLRNRNTPTGYATERSLSKSDGIKTV